MNDNDLIDKMAELWVANGGDVKGFWFSVRKIADSIDEIEDNGEVDNARREAELQAGVRSRNDGDD